MEIIVWVVFGAVAGWIVSLLDETTERSEIIGHIIIGITGSLVGGFIMNMLGQTGAHGLNIASLVVAGIGALLVLMTYKTVTDQI